MSICGEDTASTSEMTVITEPVGRKDETFFWFDNVEFLVEDIRFRVPQYPFHVGSKYFVEKFSLSPSIDGDDSGGVVELKGVTAAQFQVFLKLLFPMHLTSTTTTFPTEDWLTILTLSTLWHFHEARKLAIEHLQVAGELTELELINVGRAAYIPRWVLAGYKVIVERPRANGISDEDANAIGLQAAHRLWSIRYRIAVSDDGCGAGSVEGELISRFAEELATLEAVELEHRTRTEVERDELEAEERRKFKLEAEAKAAAEREEIERMEEEEKAKMEEERKAKVEEERKAKVEEAEMREAETRELRMLQEEAEAKLKARKARMKERKAKLKAKAKPEPEPEPTTDTKPEPTADAEAEPTADAEAELTADAEMKAEATPAVLPRVALPETPTKAPQCQCLNSKFNIPSPTSSEFGDQNTAFKFFTPVRKELHKTLWDDCPPAETKY